MRRRIRDWLVFSDLHILLVAAAWMQGSSALFAYTLPLSFLMVASVGAFLVYRVDRLLIDSPEDALNTPERLDFSRRHRLVLLASAAGLMVMAMALALTMRVLWLEMAFVVGMLGFIYPLKLLPGGRRPKDVAWLKSAMIAFCWVGGGVLLPLVLFGRDVSLAMVGVAGAYRALWIMPNLLASDWLDREGDRMEGAGNLVASWLVGKAWTVLRLGVLVAASLAALLVWFGLPPLWVAWDLVGLVIMSWAAWRLIGPKGDQIVTTSRTRAEHIVQLDFLVGWPVTVWLLLRVFG